MLGARGTAREPRDASREATERAVVQNGRWCRTGASGPVPAWGGLQMGREGHGEVGRRGDAWRAGVG